jgi:hypothetical protein
MCRLAFCPSGLALRPAPGARLLPLVGLLMIEECTSKAFDRQVSLPDFDAEC